MKNMPKKGGFKHVVRQTAAAAITLPAPLLKLALLRVVGHATQPTCLSIRYDGISQALFPCAPGGQKTYRVNWPIGINIPATWLTSVGVGAPVAWTLEFIDGPADGAPLTAYRGIIFQAALAASGTPVTVNYDAGVMRPLGAIAAQTGGVAGANSRWAYPAVGSFVAIVEGTIQTYLQPIEPAPDGLPESISLTLIPTLAGAASTAQAVVYY